MIKGGYVGKVLRINLSTGEVTTEKLPDEKIVRKYIGCFGLGLWYLMRELRPGIGALEPENPLIFMNGPFTGIRVPSPTNCTCVTLNADTGYTAGRAHGHGWWGAYMKMAGYDGIIVNGASDKWVYLWIDDNKVEIRDASKYLGKDTHETEDLIKGDLGVPAETGKGVSVNAMGPAGENLCAGALIEHDKNHSFAHSGVGTVMGSKKLKAIAIRGTGGIPIANEEKLKAASSEWSKMAAKLGVSPIIARGGVPRDEYVGVKGIVGLSVKNWLVNDLPRFGDRMSKQNVTPKPCYRCAVACSYDAEIIEGPFKGYVASLSGGGENMEGSASIVGAGKEPGETFYLTDLNDRLGFETSSVGCAMAVAFEAYEKGVLTKEDTDGLELKWGDVKVIETLIKRIAHREGKFANMLADGPKIAAHRIGLPQASVDIKGSGMNLHDWRRAWGVLLGQAIGGGSGWPAPGADCWTAEADAGYPEKANPLSPFGKGEEVAATAGLKMWNDSHGSCWFATWGIPGIIKITADVTSGATGWDFTPEEVRLAGDRILALERIFNMKWGLTAEDDYKVSPRITDPAPADAGPAAGKSVAPYIEGWVRDYYQALGWDRKTGKPLINTLKKLGLEEFVDIVWG
jgi:aldehyde:ferredoxin oxidoreductase